MTRALAPRSAGGAPDLRGGPAARCLPATVAGLLVLVLAACGGTTAATRSRPSHVTSTVSSTATPKVKPAPLPVAEIRARYLASVAPADRAFGVFSAKLTTLTASTTAASVDKVVTPAAAAIAASGRELYALRASAPPKIAKALYAVVVSDNTVWQALRDLEAGWGSRSFDTTSWQSAYLEALKSGDAAASTLRKELGLPRSR